MFLFWNWFSWTTCNNRYNILRCGFLTSFSLSFNRKSPSRFGVGYTILTFCGRSMAFFVSFCLLLRIIVSIKNMSNKTLKNANYTIKTCKSKIVLFTNPPKPCAFTTTRLNTSSFSLLKIFVEYIKIFTWSIFFFMVNLTVLKVIFYHLLFGLNLSIFFLIPYLIFLFGQVQVINHLKNNKWLTVDELIGVIFIQFIFIIFWFMIMGELDLVFVHSIVVAFLGLEGLVFPNLHVLFTMGDNPSRSPTPVSDNGGVSSTPSSPGDFVPGLENSLTRAIVEEAKDTIHTLGRTRDVTVYDLYYRSSHKTEIRQVFSQAASNSGFDINDNTKVSVLRPGSIKGYAHTIVGRHIVDMTKNRVKILMH